MVCFVGMYRSFGFIKISEFELSFDFLFFVALVLASVAWILLALGSIHYLFLLIYGRILFIRLKKCSIQEKAFLYYRVYENGNELQIDMNSDSYFYKWGGKKYLPYRQEFNAKEKIIKFLRRLENKKIIRNCGNQTMIIPQQVWNILVKHADEIFKGIKGNDGK